MEHQELIKEAERCLKRIVSGKLSIADRNTMEKAVENYVTEELRVLSNDGLMERLATSQDAVNYFVAYLERQGEKTDLPVDMIPENRWPY